ncbi:MAG: FAD-dependent oxidoreductase [Halorientalis sp.]
MPSRETSNGEPVSGDHRSIWLATTEQTRYGGLDGDKSVETAVVGGGIVGVMAAYHLSRAGHDVAVVERDRIVTGTTGHTTAKLTSLHGLQYAGLVDRIGERKARQYAKANERAIDDVETIVDRHGIDCSFERLPAVTYVSNASEQRDIEREVETARHLGLPASYTESIDAPLDVTAAVTFDSQAQFHPRRFLLALADRIDDNGGTIYEETAVTDVRGDGPFLIDTEYGTIEAEHVVVATHFPIVDDWLFFSRVYPKQSYVLAVTLDDPAPEAMYYRPGTPYFSVRPLPPSVESTALVGGQNHRTGHGGETADRYRALEREARRRFDVASVDYRWSTEDFVSIDGVPFVGIYRPAGEDAYVATGFGGWGMTNGIASGRLLADQVLGRGSPWAAVYRPSRLTIDGSLRKFISHNTKSARHLVEGRLRSRNAEGTSQLSDGEATIVDADDGPVGVYRDDDGEIHAVSAVCTHLGCVVNWNDAERSWDCPCHGSRFGIDGHVIDTPAIADLEQVTVDQFETVGDQQLDGRLE